MDNRSNVISMMVLGAGIIALGSSIISGEVFRPHELKKQSYIVEGVEEESGGATEAVADAPIALRMQTADATKGAEVFKKCASCHNIADGGANGTGPNLWAVMGKPHAVHPGYSYSEALKGRPGNWDWEGMDAWLKKPATYAPGTKMSFAGLSKPDDRANVIAYLNAQGSNLPMPAAPPAAAPAGDAPASDNAATPAAGNAAAPAKK
jgi:cytochrome c